MKGLCIRDILENYKKFIGFISKDSHITCSITQKLFPKLTPAKIGVKTQSFLSPTGRLKNGV